VKNGSRAAAGISVVSGQSMVKVEEKSKGLQRLNCSKRKN
jgi:hypothetical protein